MTGNKARILEPNYHAFCFESSKLPLEGAINSGCTGIWLATNKPSGNNTACRQRLNEQGHISPGDSFPLESPTLCMRHEEGTSGEVLYFATYDVAKWREEQYLMPSSRLYSLEMHTYDRKTAALTSTRTMQTLTAPDVATGKPIDFLESADPAQCDGLHLLCCNVVLSIHKERGRVLDSFGPCAPQHKFTDGFISGRGTTVMATSSGPATGEVVMWDSRASRERPSAVIPVRHGVRSACPSVTAASMHHEVFLGLENGSISLFDWRRSRAPIMQTSEVHQEPVRCLRVNPHLDSLLLSAAASGSIRLWTVSTAPPPETELGRDPRSDAAINLFDSFNDTNSGANAVRWVPCDPWTLLYLAGDGVARAYQLPTADRRRFLLD